MMRKSLFLLCSMVPSVCAMNYTPIPSLQVITAYKIYQMDRANQFTCEQKEILESWRRMYNDPSGPLWISENVLQYGFRGMPKEKAELYAMDLCAGFVKSKSRRPVQQKIAGWQMRIALNR